MRPKPAHLGPEYASQFSDPSVIAAYHRRPPYPAEVFDVLAKLVIDEPRSVLDVGCGTGEIARGLASRVASVDALDPSAGMLYKGQASPGGRAANLVWRHGFAEDAPLNPPYALIVAGASLHWMAWDVVLPRFHDALTPRGLLVIVDNQDVPPPWEAAVRSLIARRSTNRDFRPYDVVDELEQRKLFRPLGRHETAPVWFEQRLEEYVESFHSRNGLSRDRMDPVDAEAFDRELTALVEPYISDNIVRRRILAELVWGLPGPSAR